MSHKLIRINSEEREQLATTSSNNFQVNFGNSTQLAAVNRIVVKSISIPNVQYNIKVGAAGAPFHSTTNVFTFDDGAPQSITVTPGNYTIAQLITALTSAAIAVTDGLAIIVNPITGKLDFSSTTPITYYGPSSGNYMAETLGISADSGPLVSTFSAQDFPDLAGHPNLYIVSNALSDGSHLVSPTLGSLAVVAVVPKDVLFGSVIQFRTFVEELEDIEYTSRAQGKSIQSVDLSVYDGDGQLVDMGGLDWTFTCIAHNTF